MYKFSRLQKGLDPFLNCKDHLVSGEHYEVMKNREYKLLVTSPIPGNLQEYYESEKYISHTDQKKSLMDRVYQAVKTHTIKNKVALINALSANEKTILDIGAGTGDFLLACKMKNWNVFGVEPSEKARIIARDKGVSLTKDLLFLKGEKFDVITLWHVLEHIENLEEYIQDLKRFLKSNGTIVVAAPNHKCYDANHYGAFWAAYDVPRHVWHFSQESINLIFKPVFMKVVQSIPMKFDAYYISLLSQKYKTGRMNIFKSFWIGFISNMKAIRTSEYSSIIYVLKNKKDLS